MSWSLSDGSNHGGEIAALFWEVIPLFIVDSIAPLREILVNSVGLTTPAGALTMGIWRAIEGNHVPHSFFPLGLGGRVENAF